MRIGLNGQKLLIDKLAGPEIYTYNTFKALAALDDDNYYTVYLEKEPAHKWWKELSNRNKNFSYKVVPKILSWTQIGLASQLFIDNQDLFFSATHTIPGINLRKTKIISMIHGMEYKINNQFHNNPIKKLIHPLILWWVLTFSNAIVVPSSATKKAILKIKWPFFNKNKIMIIPEGVNKSFHKRSETEINKVKKKYKLDNKPYLIFVSTIQPRKNIPIMVNAFSKFLEKHKKYNNHLLLISGKLGWLYQDSLNAPKKYKIENNVKFLGRTPDEDLPPLLSGAEGFISCSLEEGFGIPLLEAMACETPAIVSNIPAFKELGKNNVIYVNPKSVESIKTGIENLLVKRKGNVLVKPAKSLASQYTWEKGGNELMSLFDRVFKNT
ncbi:glycosyltransferase family 4 protein [Patescibacteria group bacterium]